MTDEPKLIYKYTHEEAVRDGELVTIAIPGEYQLYITRSCYDRLRQAGYGSYDIMVLIRAGLLTMRPIAHPGQRHPSQYRKQGHETIETEWIEGCEIRNDDKLVPIITLLLPGES